MKPYLTILLDSFRMLKAKTIFWVTLGISLLVAVIYLSMGFDEKGATLFFGLVPIENEVFRKGTPQAEKLYVTLFTKLIAEYWLSWIAVLLALISCSSIFTESLKEGAAGMELTKKLSRWQVFVAKFAGSLLFVLIQVGLFVLIVFLALRWRVGSWNFSIFWYVPLILLVFSYLYSFMVLVAVKTRSSMTALVLTLVLWGLSSFIGYIEGQFYSVIKIQKTLQGYEQEAAEMAQPEGSDDEAPDSAEEEETAESVTVVHGPDEAVTASMERWYQGLVAVYGIFPKTGRTMEVADRLLVINGERGIAKGTFMSIMMDMSLEEEEEEDD